MTDLEIIAAHKELAAYHEQKARESALDILGEFHESMASELRDYADRVQQRLERSNP